MIQLAKLSLVATTLAAMSCATTSTPRPKSEAPRVELPARVESTPAGEPELDPTSPAARFALAERYQVGRGVPLDMFEAAYQAYRAATAGHAKAQAWLQTQATALDLSALLWFGRLLESNGDRASARHAYADATRRLDMAIEREDRDALTVRGLTLRFGFGSPRNGDRAYVLLRRAAELGDARAQYVIGLAYLLRTDERLGLEWLRLASAQEYVRARTALGLYSASCRHDHSMDAEAFAWLERSAEQGDPIAQTALGVLGETHDSRTHSEPNARQWYERAAAQGNSTAEARLCELELADEQPTTPTLRWCRKAAEDGIPQAEYTLGTAYRDGRLGVARDAREAVRWLDLAAQHEHVAARLALGMQYAAGDGVPRDAATALLWLRRAAEHGDVRAQLLVADYYERGEGIARDNRVAADWNRRAALAGDPTAQHALGRMYEHGIGVVRDPRLAASWHKRAEKTAGSSHPCELSTTSSSSCVTPESDPPEAARDVCSLFSTALARLLWPWPEAEPARSSPIDFAMLAQTALSEKWPLSKEPVQLARPSAPAGTISAAQRAAAVADASKLLLCPRAETQAVEEIGGVLSVMGCGALVDFDCRMGAKTCVPAADKIETSGTVRGSLSKAVIRATLQTGLDQVRDCYTQEYAHLPASVPLPTLRIVVKFTIAPAGAVSESTIEGGDSHFPILGACMRRMVDRLAFPQPQGGGIVIVSYPFMLEDSSH